MTMHARHWISFAVVIALLFLLAACAAPAPPTDAPYNPQIDPANFVTRIDNPYFPLVPGTTFVYEGDGEHIEIVVTHDTKTILGIACVVVRDTVTVDGEIAEDTYDWYAQDANGNVWYMGEDTKEYEGGAVTSTAGAWEAGVDGALPGIVMQAHPQVGQSYRQEYYAGEAEDMAEVIELGATATVPYGSYDNLIITREWTPLQPGIVENKYYAEGIGLVLELTVEGGSGRVELISVTSE